MITKFHKKHFGRIKQRKQLDFWFQRQARKQGYNIVGLDDLYVQLKRLKDIPLKAQAESLVELARYPEQYIAGTDSLVQAYLSFDMDKIARVVEMSSAPEERREVCDNRNNFWMEKLPALIKKESSFIVVGVGHLPGETGLIAQFRRLGYSVEPIK